MTTEKVAIELAKDHIFGSKKILKRKKEECAVWCTSHYRYFCE
jgi:hypothetical protein